MAQWKSISLGRPGRWLIASPLAAASWLGLDAAAAYAGWHGLRSTRLRPSTAGGLAAGSLALFGGINALAAGPGRGAWAASLLGIPLHLAGALLAGRSHTPVTWTTSGTWERHQVSALELAVNDLAVPALRFEPLQPSQGAVVLLHGAGAHKTFYTWPLTEGLVASGFTVYGLDLDGHGENQRTLDFPSVAESMSTAIEALRAEHRWLAVVGISLGGCVAAYAAAHGLELDALAILESPHELAVTARAVRNERLTLARMATWSLHRYSGTIPLVRAWRTRPVHSRISTAALIERLDLLGSLAHVRCPLWLCYGGSDLVVPPDQLRRIAAAAPPGTPLAIIPRATHLSLPIDRRAIRALQQWLGAEKTVQHGEHGDTENIVVSSQGTRDGHGRWKTVCIWGW